MNRLDNYLVTNYNIDTRSKSRDLIKRGLVLVNGLVITKPGYDIKISDTIEIREILKYVSRAGLKLEDAINSFNIDIKNKIVVDIGTSTGGFSDYCIQNGAKKVYGFDVGNNQLSDKLKNIDNLIVLENTNILDVLDMPDCDIFLIDVSFTSIKNIINHISKYKKPIIALVKPQFEVGISNLKKGIVKNKNTALKAVLNIINYSNKLGYININYKECNLHGKSGNIEYLLYLQTTTSNNMINNSDHTK